MKILRQRRNFAVAATFASVALTVDGNRDPETVWAEVDAYLSK